MAKETKDSRLSKYSSLIIYTLLFLIVTASILGYNYYVSSELAQKTSEINIAARQGVIVQKLAKNVMNIDLLTSKQPDDEQLEGVLDIGLDGSVTASNYKTEPDQLAPEVIEAIDQLRKSRDLFEKTLTAFEKGGATTGLQDEQVVLSQVAGRAATQSAAHARELWEPYKRLIDGFIASSENNKINKDTIEYAVDYARIFNSYLFFETNDLTKALEKQAQAQTNLLKLIQTVGIALAFLLFFLITFGAIRQLLRTDSELEDARRETADILRTVDSGLFLVDRDLYIGSQHSTSLEKILLTSEISGRNLTELLRSFVSQEDIDITADFIEQLYNPRVKEKLISDLNPLKAIAVTLEEAGRKVKRYLDFNFSRIYKHTDDGKEISHILVSVNDITKAVHLEERLEAERRQNDEQIEMISTILNSDMRMIRQFVKSANRGITRMNDTLKNPQKSHTALQNKLTTLFREAHSLKGESSALALTPLTIAIIDFEGTIKELQQHSKLSGDDFLPLTVRLDDIIGIVKTIDMLSKRLGVNTTSLKNTDAASEFDAADNAAHAGDETQPMLRVAPKDSKLSAIGTGSRRLTGAKPSPAAQDKDSTQPDSQTSKKDWFDNASFDETKKLPAQDDNLKNNSRLKDNTRLSTQTKNEPDLQTTNAQVVDLQTANSQAANLQTIDLQAKSAASNSDAPNPESSNTTSESASLTESQPKNSEPENHHQAYFDKFVAQLAERANKDVRLMSEGVERLDGQSDKHNIMKEIALQLVRNALAHGIELPEVRSVLDKSRTGLVKLFFKETSHTMSLVVEDDGSGINYEKIRQKALSLGKYDPDEVKNWSQKQLLSLMFSSGFSTAELLTEDAGQGVGLDVVKARLKEIGGKIKVETELGKYTRFTIACVK